MLVLDMSSRSRENLELEISLFRLPCLINVHIEEKKQIKVSKLTKNELLVTNIGSTSNGGQVMGVRGDLAKVQLTLPACTEVGKDVTLSRCIEKHWWLVGKCFCQLSRLIRYLLDVTGANLHMYHFWSTQMQVFFFFILVHGKVAFLINEGLLPTTKNRIDRDM
ncbi:initiation factor eIF2 gamma, C terminal-domain-containing protein [Suillus fuscotomentosus]|uniref:Initiation factor eIF2 gamma, C terminal-domain-containing protein n=1 Tax=Suillus fuscotomentosus TaxID=1912939 RepID=A0AAD4HGA4_9AGAM|nr:initiation factor eIF2 gamma, C terminal-domain-containing protein [Suillus fuscotomentosus]KAG1895483.1 initiation factor eIF2 gamma, C terminal-domain-containing protein [Suillus fuscotomentosus]